MSDLQDLIEKTRDQLEQWDSQFYALLEKSKTATDSMRSEYNQKIEIIQLQRDETLAKLKKLEGSNDDDTWENLKASIEMTWQNMGKKKEPEKNK